MRAELLCLLLAIGVIVSGHQLLIQIDSPVDSQLWNALQHPAIDIWQTSPTIILASEDVVEHLAHTHSFQYSKIPFDLEAELAKHKAQIDEVNQQNQWVVPTLKAALHSHSVTPNFLANITYTWFLNYHTYDDIVLHMEALHQAFPTQTQLFSIGTTYNGNTINGIRLTGSSGFTNEKPEMIYNACQHAREWISPATAMYVAQSLLLNYTSDATVTELLDSFSYSIIPVVNVDGYEYTWTNYRMWRKNRSPNENSQCIGTDLNRNWAFEWGGVGASDDPCSDTYRGASAFSELETQALSSYISGFSAVAAYIDFHSYSQYILLPWSFTPIYTEDHSNQFAVGNLMAAAIVEVYGKEYEVGDWYTVLYPSSGTSIDWVYSEGIAILSYTIELRDKGFYGFLLPPEQIIPTGQEIFAAMLVLGKSALDLTN